MLMDVSCRKCQPVSVPSRGIKVAIHRKLCPCRDSSAGSRPSSSLSQTGRTSGHALRKNNKEHSSKINMANTEEEESSLVFFESGARLPDSASETSGSSDEEIAAEPVFSSFIADEGEGQSDASHDSHTSADMEDLLENISCSVSTFDHLGTTSRE